MTSEVGCCFLCCRAFLRGRVLEVGATVLECGSSGDLCLGSGLAVLLYSGDDFCPVDQEGEMNTMKTTEKTVVQVVDAFRNKALHCEIEFRIDLFIMTFAHAIDRNPKCKAIKF